MSSRAPSSSLNSGPPHRGASGNIGEFASAFVKQRLRGFAKDMKICLTSTPSTERAGPTHAYFPALMSCCATLEYLAGLYAGKFASRTDKNQITSYARSFLPQPDYSNETIRVLITALRHPVAHRGIATGIWVDKHDHYQGRRVTWYVSASAHRPALKLIQEPSALVRDPPWKCSYTHRVHVHLDRLWRDIQDSALGSGGYVDTLTSNEDLLMKFEKCMKQLYPP